MIRSLIHAARLMTIARTMARHGALSPLVEAFENFGAAPAWLRFLHSFLPKPRNRAIGALRPGERLANALAALGPAFIKFGQMLSTRSDLLGDEMASDLSRLQDRLEPFSAEQARATIAMELGRPVEQVFIGFDDTPVSAASIAQVHYAMVAAPTGDGEGSVDPIEVAVKVLRPGIERAFARDVALMRWLAEWSERSQPRLRRLKPVEVVESFAETVRIEMDLRMEAAAAAELAENFVGDTTYRVPAVDWQRTARRVLTLRRLSGIPIDDRDGLIAAGQDLDQVLTRAAAIFFNQTFRDGYFHGDQHPGNMFVAPDGTIGAVDFGIMGRLDKKTRHYLADMLMAFLRRDYRRLADVHFDAGLVPAHHSRDSFAQACRSIGEPIFGRALGDISFASLLGQLFRLGDAFDMEVQPQLLLLQKNMLMAEGVSRRLSPGLNIWTLAQPLIEEWVRENRGPEARLRETGEALVGVIERLPANLASLERALAAAGANQASGTRQSGSAWRTVDWLILAAIAATAVVAVVALLE